MSMTIQFFFQWVSLFLLLTVVSCGGETGTSTAASEASPADNRHQAFYEEHTQFKEASITNRRFKHADIVPLINALSPPFQVALAGRSVQNRAIYHIQLGEGPVQVLMWSQMHGNEATATMALMDIFNFFQADGDAFDAYRQEVLSKLSLHFIPMLNPDGAELFQRRNALHIDVNRDALRLSSPEARALKRIRDEINADWGFNLHDQGFYYAVGDTPKQASISFLAPAFNEKKDVNENRRDAMQLIAGLNGVVQDFIPGQVGKYNDAFEPRAFGDNIQKWGTRTILIETGGYDGDPEKQELRRINFTILLSAFQRIAEKSYLAEAVEGYENIPFNNYGGLQDLILRGVQIQVENNWYTVDMAFQRREVEYNENEAFYYQSRITDIGDLSVLMALQEKELEGYRAVSGRAYSKVLKDTGTLKRLDLYKLLQQGITDFRLNDWPQDNRYHLLPIRILPKSRKSDNEIRPGNNPSLLLQKEGKTDFLVVNGRLYDLRNQEKVKALLEIIQ